MIKALKFSLSISLILLLTLKLEASIRLPSILGNHMVVRHNSTIILWGWCNPGEKIKVLNDWNAQVDSTIGLNTAKWSVEIKTSVSGGPHKITLIGQNTLVLDDILFGEVWLCSGQSNMEMSGEWNSRSIQADIPQANHPNIRFFTVLKSTSTNPQDNLEGKWLVCTPENMKSFSAVGYYFGRDLNEMLKEPIGLINSSWGGTPAEAWTPKEEIAQNLILKESNLRLDSSPSWPIKPGYTYNSMIYPLKNYKVTGAIWYQGEANIKENTSYSLLLTTLIKSWRGLFQNNFPFYYVQIAPFAGYGNNLNGPLLREAQTRALDLEGTGMIIISDLVDDINDIHPKNKRDVGLRLANLALTKTYGIKNLPYRYPSFDSFKLKGDAIEINFKDAEEGLMSRNENPTGFLIAGDDQIYHTATVKVKGNKATVFSKEVKKPLNVRFGYSNSSVPNLFSKEGLPVNIFRTDSLSN